MGKVKTSAALISKFCHVPILYSKHEVRILNLIPKINFVAYVFNMKETPEDPKTTPEIKNAVFYIFEFYGTFECFHGCENPKV